MSVTILEESELVNMSGQYQILMSYWEKGDFDSFFKNLLSSIREQILRDDDINAFLKKLQDSYPIPEDYTLNSKMAKQLMSIFKIDQTSELLDVERRILGHYFMYFAKEYQDGNI